MKIAVIGPTRYANWIKKAEIVYTIKDADLVLFTGGADVFPAIYGHKKNPKSHCHIDRDNDDVLKYNEAVKLNKPMLGICRGSQFITAVQPKGYLIQHVNSHAIGGTHEIKFSDGDILHITSTHHQMMYPFDVDNHELIAWSSPSRSNVYELSGSDDIIEIDKEPEIVYYKDTNALCVQGHPEMMHLGSPVIGKLNDLLIEKLFNNET